MSYDNYTDACRASITRSVARAFISEHGASWCDFIRDIGNRPNYKGFEVLDWLGY